MLELARETLIGFIRLMSQIRPIKNPVPIGVLGTIGGQLTWIAKKTCMTPLKLMGNIVVARGLLAAILWEASNLTLLTRFSQQQ